MNLDAPNNDRRILEVSDLWPGQHEAAALGRVVLCRVERRPPVLVPTLMERQIMVPGNHCNTKKDEKGEHQGSQPAAAKKTGEISSDTNQFCGESSSWRTP